MKIRPAQKSDLTRLDEIRAAAFAPVFASFRRLLGDEIYELAQAGEDEKQGEYLASLFEKESGWDVYAVEVDDETAGFVSIQVNSETKVGEIGLNAVDPKHAGRGIGTSMYEFALAVMKEKDMEVATVSTGNDESHAPARRAYEKAGFGVSVPSIWMCRKL